MAYDNGRRGGGDRKDKRQGGYGSEGGRDDFGRGRSDDRESSYSSYSPPATAARPDRGAGAVLETVTTTLKFYNADKGFGFVSVPGKGDAFLHVSAFDQEPSTLPEGTTVVCTIGADPRQPGKQKVFEVTSYDVSTASPSAARAPSGRPTRGPRNDGPTSTGTGTVQWFNPTKGFGFVLLEDGKSVFVHATTVERSGLETIGEGDRLTVDYVSEEKGLSARSVRFA